MSFLKSLCCDLAKTNRQRQEVVREKESQNLPSSSQIGHYMGRYLTTVTLGQYFRRYNGYDFRFMMEMLVRNGHRDLDEGLIEIRPEMIGEEETVDVYMLTGKELGLHLFVSRIEFFYRASQYGFCLCPPEIGPLVLMKKQDRNHYNIAMCPEKTWTYDPNERYGKRVDFGIFYLSFDEVKNKQCIGITQPPNIAHEDTWLFIRPRGQVVFDGMTLVQINPNK